MQAGAATVDITPATGLPMGGYGRRTGMARGRADPLLARVLVLDDGATEVALVVCDLLGVGTDLVSAVRREAETRAGLPGTHVLVAATHTHAGPAGIRAADAPGYVESTAGRVGDAVARARASRGTVSLKAAAAGIRPVGQNRRDPGGPVEDRVRVLLADPGREHPPVATLVNHACHSTVREHDNLDWSADWPGAMCRAVEGAVGGTAVYLQGAAGDINPVWSAHDPVEVERVGGIVGAAAVGLVHQMRPLGTGQWCINLSWSEDVEVPAAGTLLGDARLAVASTALEVERRVRRHAAEIDADLADLERSLSGAPDRETRRRLRARVNELSVDRQFSAGPAGRPTQRVELQAVRVSERCAVVSLPGEFFAATGRDVAARTGVEHTFIAGYANGSVGYVPTADEYGAAGYEVGMTQFPPGTAERVADAAVELVRSLY